MATSMQTELAIAPIKTATTPGSGNVESVNSKEGTVTVIGVSGGSSRQGTMDDSSSRFLLVNSTKNDFDLLWSLRKYLVLLGILAVSVTYNSGLSPPGGFWNKNLDGHEAGDPVLSVEFFQRYELFFYCNATAFAASLVLIILLLSKSVTRQKLWLRSMQFTMIVDLFSLMGAYAAGSCRALKSSIYILVLVFAVFIYVWIHILVSTTTCVVPQVMKKKLKEMTTHVLSRLGIYEGQPSSLQEIKDLEEARKFILMLVTFSATVTYQAGLGPPAGFWAENGSSRPYKYRPSTPVLRSHYLQRYNIFISCNSTSFVASLVTVILLLSPELSRNGIRSKAVVICVLADPFFLVGAYAAGCCRDVATSFYVMFIIIVVLMCIALLVGIFVYKPVAQWLQLMKVSTVRCMSVMLSSNFGSNRSRNADQEGFHASHQNASGHARSARLQANASQLENVSSAPSDDSASQPEHLPIAPAEDSASQPEHVPCAPAEDTASQPEHVLSEPADDSATQLEHIPSAPPEDSASQLGHVSSAPAEHIASQPEHTCACSQQVSDTFVSEGKSCGESFSADKEKAVSTDEAVSYFFHPPELTNAEDSISNMENQATYCNLDTTTMETLSNTGHPSMGCLELVNTTDYVSAYSQHVAGTKEQYSTDDIIITDIPAGRFSEHNGVTKDLIVDEGPPLPVAASGNAECADKHTSLDYNHHIDIVTVCTNVKHFENGHTNNNQSVPDQNAHFNQTERHIKKTRTCLLLLAILAVSLTYQSGLNPPGGFWSGSAKNHLAGDRILEDNDHARFIAFFYLNAVAFVASLVMILMLLNKNVIEKVTKRRELQITMIVVLLSLTGSFVMGSCRDAEKSIYISAILFLVFAFVVIHVLIAIHAIPTECTKVMSANLEKFWSALPQLCYKQSHLALSPLCDKQIMNITGDKEIDHNHSLLKEMDRRRNLLLTLAILAATVTYQAGVNPPGGVWSDDKDASGTPGNPILQDNHPGRYNVFYYANSVSFVSSVVITILLVNKESFEHGIRSYALRVCLVAGLLGLLIAYAAGSCRNWKESIFLIIIAVAVLVSLVIQVLLSSMHDTLGRPLAQCMESLQAWVFVPENAEREITSEPTETSSCKEKIKRHKYLMLIAILAASITYQAGLNQPGGFWSDDDKGKGKGHVAGNPVLRDINHRRYKTFFCFNAVSFMTSIVVIMLLLSKSVRKKAVQLDVLFLIMILDLLALMTAYAAGSCRKFWTSVYVYVLVAAVLIYLVIVIILSRRIVKCLRK